MKTFAIALSLAALVVCTCDNGTYNGTDAHDADWVVFKRRHNRTFKSSTQEGHRYNNFLGNTDFVKNHHRRLQAGQVTFNVSMNKFSDMSITEFVARRCGYNSTRLTLNVKAVFNLTTTTTTTTTTTPNTMTTKALKTKKTTTPKTTKTTTPKTTKTTTPKTTKTTTPKTTKTTTPKTTKTTTPKITKTTTPKTTKTTTPNKKKTTTTNTPIITNAPESATLNWTAEGYVTDVKDQGQCGSDWAFSSTGAIEGQYFKKTGQLVSLSEKNLVDCVTDNSGCNGGTIADAFDYVQSNKGIATETNYPYAATQGSCMYETSMDSGVVVQGYIKTYVSEAQLQIVLSTIGPISVAIDASHQSFQLYTSGIYNEPACSSTNLDLAVLLVGYGTENGQDYWLLKNSWGTGWGENGYFKLARNQNNMCGIATNAAYPVL